MHGNLVPVEAMYANLSGAKLKKKHRVLYVGPHDLNGYDLSLAEDAFTYGLLLEVCSYEAFVANADIWKHEFDVFVINSQSELDARNSVTGADVKNAMQKFMNAGVKLIFLCMDAPNGLRKYDVNGNYTTTSCADILGGLGVATYDFSAATGRFEHSEDYPFGQYEILRTECIPSNKFMRHFTATDPDVIFPVRAVQGETVANCTAYKPGAFFVVSSGGTTGASVDAIPYWKYINLGLVCRVLIGDTDLTRLAADACYGKRIAGLSVDCDRTNDLAAIQSLHEAFGPNTVMEWGLVAKSVTDEVAGYFRTLPGPQRIVSHTYSHFADRITVTDEVHTIPASQLVRLNRPFKAKITYVKTIDDSLTFTAKVGSITRTAPTAGQYVVNTTTESGSTGELVDGWLKFHADDVGKQIKITYTCVDEALEVLGSLDVLRAKGALTHPTVYMTLGKHSVEPTTLLRAEQEGATIADHVLHGIHKRAQYAIAPTHQKRPLILGCTMKYEWRFPTTDTDLLSVSKEEAKNRFNLAIARCQQFEEPFVFYMHDFPISEVATNSIWLDTSGRWGPDWKQATYAETRAYVQEMYSWMIAQLNAQLPYWMTRGEYAARYEYLHRWLAYDVQRMPSTVRVFVVNKGPKSVEGLTFRVPTGGTPKRVRQINGADVDYTYSNNLATCWFDLPAGQSTVLEVQW